MLRHSQPWDEHRQTSPSKFLYLAASVIKDQLSPGRQKKKRERERKAQFEWNDPHIIIEAVRQPILEKTNPNVE
jgi:hypothetical protein